MQQAESDNAATLKGRYGKGLLSECMEEREREEDRETETERWSEIETQIDRERDCEK